MIMFTIYLQTKIVGSIEEQPLQSSHPHFVGCKVKTHQQVEGSGMRIDHFYCFNYF